MHILAKYDISWEVKEAALTKLDDQGLVTDLIISGSDEIRHVATSKLTDQTKLADLAKNDKDWRVRVAAYRKLDNEQAAKREIAIYESNQFQFRTQASLYGGVNE